MTDKVKKIIAREGLVLLPFVMAFIVLMTTVNYMPYQYYDTLFFVILLGYLLTRFIIWAVQTLRRK